MEEFNVVFVCDNNYVLPTIVAIYSLLDNCQLITHKINIHILAVALSQKDISLFYKIEEVYNTNIIVYDQSLNFTYMDKLSQITPKSHVTSTALLKFEIPNILPETIDKILYLDSDIIIKKDISLIFNYDISDTALAACFEYWKCQLQLWDYTKDFNIPEFYFNSGVLLINLKKWRENNISYLLWKKKIEIINTPNNKSLLMDQDVLNIILGKECIHLPYKYNCNPRFINNKNLEIFNKIYNTNYKKGKDIYDDAVIIHYVGKEDKPWIYYDGRCREIWDKYYNQAGYIANELKRKSNKPTVFELINKIVLHIKTKGFIKTVKYIYNK